MTMQTSFNHAGFLRRCGALLYDTLIIIAIEMMAAGVVVAILEALVAAGVMHYGSYADVSDFLSHHPIWSIVYKCYLVGVWSYFFIYFWGRGQTLGMRAWKLQIQTRDGDAISTQQAIIRLITALFGLGNILLPFTKPKRALQDICSNTNIVVLAKAN